MIKCKYVITTPSQQENEKKYPIYYEQLAHLKKSRKLISFLGKY